MKRVWDEAVGEKGSLSNSNSWSDDYLRIISWTCRVPAQNLLVALL